MTHGTPTQAVLIHFSGQGRTRHRGPAHRDPRGLRCPHPRHRPGAGLRVAGPRLSRRNRLRQQPLAPASRTRGARNRTRAARPLHLRRERRSRSLAPRAPPRRMLVTLLGPAITAPPARARHRHPRSSRHEHRPHRTALRPPLRPPRRRRPACQCLYRAFHQRHRAR